MTDTKPAEKIARSLRIAKGKCPNGHSLMSEDRKFDGQCAIKMQIRLRGKTDTIYLNPFYGRFDYECGIPLVEGDIVELLCPTCDAPLSIDTMCKLCDVPMFAVQLPDGGQVEACPTIGCHNHSLKIVDLDAQLERMYVDETKVQM